MKTLLLLVAVLLIGGCVWLLKESTKPAVVARIEFNRRMLYVTNGNDQAWPMAEIILNDAFDGPRLKAANVGPGERRELELAAFYSPLKKQFFKPEFERVREVIITVDGYQLASYSK
jgi:hypothetical protein